jgi:hypothetical protein
MTEPNNPLFEDEKEFLERKKLEYERALRGDVEEIKEQTIHAGKVALVGAGIAGGVWLLVKAFSGGKSKKKHKKHKHKSDYTFEDYAGFDGYEGYDDDDHDQELDSLATAYNSPEYAYDHADRYAAGDGFYQAGSAPDYFQSQDDDSDAELDADDNGLNDYPDFPAHSSSQHGYETSAGADVDTTYGSHDGVYHTDEDHGYEEEDEERETEEETTPAHSFASTNSYQARPYDDSRRLPESNSFADEEEQAPQPASATATTATTEAPEPKKPWLIPAVVAFAKTETGKVIAAQAAAMAMAFITKKVQDIRTSNAADAGKNADLAPSPALSGASPEVWPATTAAQDVSAAAHHDNNTHREPLA